MRHIKRRLILCAALALGACQTPRPPEQAAMITFDLPDEENWAQVASTADVEKIVAVQDVWTEALDHAREKGFRRQVAEEGVLLEPDAAQPFPAPTPGFYSCRIIRFGDPSVRRQRAFTAYKSFFCYVGVNEDRLALTKDSGSERPGGYLWDDPDHRTHMVFLGAVALNSETETPAYGDDPARDIIGLFERVDEYRFRLVMPRPRPESRLDVLEMIPVP